METDYIIRQLKYTANKHRNDTLRTFDTNITALCNDVIPKLELLEKYEQEEKNGLLLRFPCKVGDTLYRVDIDPCVTPEIEPFHIDNIIICNDGEVLLKYDAYDGVICSIDNLVNGTPYLDYYMTYLSLEEAEAKLAEMEGGHE